MIEFSDEILQSRLEVFSNALDGGVSYSELRCYSGTKPASKGGAITDQVMLVKFVMPKPSKQTLIGNTLTLVNPPLATVVHTGIVKWARWFNGNGVFLADCLVSQPASETSDPPLNGVPHGTGDVWFDKTQLYEGGEVAITLGEFSEV